MKKCVLVLDEQLSNGLACNTACILGMSLGKEHPEWIGPSIYDRNEKKYPGITQIPIPILQAKEEELHHIHQKAKEDLGIDWILFTKQAQTSRSYAEYIETMRMLADRECTLLGIAIYGEKKKIDALSGSLPLKR